MKIIKSSEAVGRGHPDKIADLIADSVLDNLISKLGMKNTRFSGEVLVSAKKIFFAGEGSSYPGLELWKIIGQVLTKLDYDLSDFEFFEDYKAQSLELAELNNFECNVAGDQGIVFGFASNQTSHYLPLEYVLTKEIFLKLSNSKYEKLKQDFKILVNLEVERDDFSGELLNSFLKSIVISVNHASGITLQEIEEFLKQEIIIPILKKYRVIYNERSQWLINPSGSFLIGGLHADSGVTNRKQMADLYGASVRHGGGGLSGKDLTKIDRLGAYYLRWVAKNIVAAGLATEIEIKATYSIAHEKALTFDISNSIGCILKSLEELIDLIEFCFPTKISEIFDYFTSSRIEFSKLCEISHFGEFVKDLPWEKLNKVTSINEWHERQLKDS